MKRNATAANLAGAQCAREVSKQPSHAPQLTKVLDGHKHPIPGRWRTKTGRLFAQLKLEDATTGEKAVRRGHRQLAGEPI